jgi:glycosyltransferase involved in cell wall biosynthesis
MKVSIIVGGKFHAFNLAEQLERRNYLRQIITSYPVWKICNYYNIKKKKIITIFIKEIIERIILKLNLQKYLSFILFCTNLYFQYLSSNKVHFKSINIIVGWAGFSLKSFKKCENYKVIKILERGSSHIRFQSNILLEEYKKFNLKYFYDQKLIEKELEEYDIADYISVPSKFAEKTFINEGFKKEKIITVPYGVDLKIFRPKQKTENIFRFIYVGSISIRKGVIYTLKAFEELNLPKAELILVGKIDYEISNIIKKYKKNKNIKFIGHVNQNKLVEFYNKCDVFVISSIEDGFAMVILQALACGLPVICTVNSGGSEQIVNGRNGYIVPIRDIEKLKFKMLDLYSNEKKIIYMKKKIIFNRSKFSWDNYGDKIVKKYKILSKNF